MKKKLAFVFFVVIPMVALNAGLFYAAWQNFNNPVSERGALVPPWLNREEGGKNTEPELTAKNTENTEKTEIFHFVGAEVPNIAQRPALARGCGVVSLAMLLNFHGVDVDKMTLAAQVAAVPYRTGPDGEYFGDPNQGFVGNIYTFDEPGLGVYHGPVFDLLRYYLPDYAVDLTGQPFEVMLEQLAQNRPVWVVTNYMHTPLPFNLPSHDFREWPVGGGRVIQVSFAMHSVLVTGFDEQYIFFNDPLEYFSYAEKDVFKAAWEQFGNQMLAVVK